MLADFIYHTLHSTLAISGCVFNAYLIYLAFFKTPSVIKVYITLVLNFAITDFFACFFEFFVQQRVIPSGRTLAYISSGPCSYFGPHTCYAAYSLMLHFFAHSLWSLLMSFSYRYFILFHPAPERRSIVLILLILYIPSTIQWNSFMIGDIVFHIYHTLHSILAISGCVFNAYLIYLAFFKTPSVIKVYVTLVLNFAITDFFACFFEFFVQQRVIPNGRTLAYISSGFCSYFGPRTCYTTYSLMLHFFAHSLWSLLMSFSYRYYILFHPSPSRRTIVLILLILYMPSTVQWISFLWAQDDPKVIEGLLRAKFPAYDLDNVTITGTIDTWCFSAMFTILHMVLPVTPVYIAILCLRKKIIVTLTRKGNAMSTDTKAMHTQLLRALTYQAVLPCFFWFGIASYLLGQFDIIHHPIVESLIFVCMVFIPVLSPISCFIFVKPYYTTIVNMFTCARKFKSPVGFAFKSANALSTT